VSKTSYPESVLVKHQLIDPAWWANNGPNGTPPPQSRSWTLASRTATSNLQAQTVVFEREQK
jgi:hypothetical protein